MMVSLGMYDDICEKRIVQNQRFGLSLSDSFLTSKLAFDQARALADEIISQAIIDKKTNTIAWNNVRENREKTVRSMVPLDASLSNGMFGVLLFYLALKKVSKSEEYDDYISMIFNTIELFSNDNLHEVLLNENSKMLSTLFEVVEFFDISAQMGDRYAYYRAAINSSAEISNQTSDSSLECALRLLSIVMSKGCVEDSLEFGIGGMLDWLYFTRQNQ